MCKAMTYIQKLYGGCFVIMVVVIIILSAYIGVSAGATSSVEMTGDHDESAVQQSSGFHVLEVNGNNVGSDQCNGWNWVNCLCVGLTFGFILICTHLVHYCFLTKRLVKKKLAREVSVQMKDLTNQPSNLPVVVPGFA